MKNRLYKKYLSNPTLEHEMTYKRYKNKLNHSVRIAKSLHYTKKLERLKSDTKATWRVLNEIINKKKSKTKFPSSFKVDDNTEISDPVEIANRFCDYFTNIGPNLAKKIPTSPNSHQTFLSGNFPNSIFLKLATESEILDIASSFQSEKAVGFDKIPMSIIKQSINAISQPLTHIINLSITHGIVPDEMKIARVIPLFKAEDRDVFTNYRPVSILPSFSKFIERIVYNRFLEYFNKYNILSDKQYGFRKNHSTSLALVNLYDKISTAIDQKEIAVGIFLDLSKAFDTVNHGILFDKLKHYGIRGLAFEWVKSYFSNRLQFVQFNDCFSASKNITCGVPQGSILGPLFFLLYINDIANVSKLVDLILFADDTSIFFSHKDLNYLNNALNRELRKLSDWFIVNKLSLNLTKTKFMIFKPRQKTRHPDVQLALNNRSIEQVNETVFLGVILDETLSWKSHISHVANKISKSIGIIFRSSFYLLDISLRILYYSIIYPYLEYCNFVWASTYSSNLCRIVLLQKRAIRILNKSEFHAHTDPLFKKINILKFEDIRLLQLGQFMYCHKNSLLPKSFNSMFVLNNQVHTYDTRHSKAFHVPLCRTNIKQFCVRFQGPKLFNYLPLELVNSTSLISFKRNLKAFFFFKY